MPGRVLELSSETFETEVLSVGGPYLVDFWAQWCAPCKVMAPILEELAEEFEGQVAIAKLDISEHPTVAERLDIKSLPTLIFFKDGKPVRRLAGLKRKPLLTRELVHLLAATG